MSASLHDTDLAAWAQQSAALLREGAELDPAERDRIAEELDDMAKTARRELRTRSISLIVHLLKIEYQPERRTRSWDLTVTHQRRELDGVLEESPSLYRVLVEESPKLYASAKQAAEVETGMDVYPAANPFTLEQILRG